MQTNSHPGSTAIARRPFNAPAYYLGRKAEVWLTSYHRGAHTVASRRVQTGAGARPS